jgi:hypothetical protein
MIAIKGFRVIYTSEEPENTETKDRLVALWQRDAESGEQRQLLRLKHAHSHPAGLYAWSIESLHHCRPVEAQLR